MLHSSLVTNLGLRTFSLSKPGQCLTSTENIRLLRDGEKGGMEVEEEDYIPIATLSPSE